MYDLRWRILRKPWNQPRGSERDQLESKANHYIALFRDKIIGTARFHKINENVGQIRYLAVEEDYRRRGVGGKLLEAIHLTAKNQFIKYVFLNARETALKFFEKLGYKAIEDGPLLFGEIKHKKMRVVFSRSDLRLQRIINNLRKTLK
ncbi:MAG: GNAT family N-acetyltransferase [Candidatus Helarchaeota archaeon]|nr:GNAT family N-acetyltransferase [Candidatus Helarchaeota archaeon]